jgi:hypothetical protein
VLKQAAELFQDGLSVRQVAAALQISKTEAGRLRLRALYGGLLAGEVDATEMNSHHLNPGGHLIQPQTERRHHGQPYSA